MEFCFIVENENFDPRDEALFFRGAEEVHRLPPEATMLDVLAIVGVFPSKGQAKKNGWSGAKSRIPGGYSELTAGKLKIQMAVLNPSVPWEE